MSAQSSNENLSETSDATGVVPKAIASAENSSSRRLVAQNYSVIWLDADIDNTNEHYQNTLEDTINIFINRDECVDFLTESEDTKTILIVSDIIGQEIIPLIHNVPQLDQVYVFCPNTCLHNEWIKKWTKVKSVHTEIASLCAAIKMTIEQHNQNSIALSFIPSIKNDFNQNLDELEPSFMYTQIIKEILFKIEHDDKSLHDFIIFYRSNNSGSSKDIDLFKKEYNNKSAIYWYSLTSSIYSILNHALRTFQTHIIIKMAFFISDLHSQIEQLYQDQRINYEGKCFEVYRGQGLSKTDFEKLQKTKGGLISFNSFLSTSQSRQASLLFAESNSTAKDMVGILFVMSIDPNISSAPFAFIKQFSAFKDEEEILFSMHTIFRIDDIKQSSEHDELYEVKLRLTADDDDELRTLTKCLAEEIKGETGWKRLVNLLIKIGQLDQAEELCNELLEQTSDEQDKMYYYNQLGYIKYIQDDYRTAVSYLFKAVQTEKTTTPSDHHDVGAVDDDNIGLSYINIDEHTRILSFYVKDPIVEEPLCSNDFSLIDSFDDSRKSSNKSLFYKKALEVFEKNLPSNYPHSDTLSDGVDKVCNNMEEGSQALWFNIKLLEIREKTLPSNHPDLAVSNHTIGSIYQDRDEHLNALPFYVKAFQIMEQNLPPNHPNLATICSNIGLVYDNMGEGFKTLLFYEKAFEICQRSLLSNHPQLIHSCKRVGRVYHRMEQYSKAIYYYEKAFQLMEITLPYEKNYFTASNNNNITEENNKIEQNFQIFEFDEKQLETEEEETLHSDYLHLISCYDNFARIYEKNKEYTNALLFYTKALRTCEKIFPRNSSQPATFYNNIGAVYYQMEDYSKALLHFEHALNILKSLTFEDNNAQMKTLKDNINYVQNKTDR